MNRSTLSHIFTLMAGWLAVAYFWRDGLNLGEVPAWGAHIFVPAFILGAMLGITLTTLESSLLERRKAKAGA